MVLLDAIRLFRPRTLAQLRKNNERLQRHVDTLTEEVRNLRTALGVVVRRERQLRGIVETEYESGGEPAAGRTTETGTAPDDTRLIACVDFNGVLDTYTGWRGPGHFDPPRAGAREFLQSLGSRRLQVVVFTTRYPDDVWRWLREHALDRLVSDVTDRKPAAHVFVDDRAVCFRGDFDAALRDIDIFVAHWEKASSK